MSNISKDHPSVRVHAPPGGHSSNIFGQSEFEQSASNKKKQEGSDIFGYKQENTNPAPAKPNRNAVSTEQEQSVTSSNVAEAHAKAGAIAEQYKQTQLKSNIFGPEEPATARHVSDKNKSNIFGPEEPATTRQVSDKNKSNIFGSEQPATTRQVSDKNKSNIFGTEEPASGRHFSDKNKSNIFGVGDDDKNTRQTGGRYGVRVGYNPISGESYSTKDNVNSKNNENVKQPESTVKAQEEENGNAQAVPADATAENEHSQTASNGDSQVAAEKPTNGDTQATVEKSTNGNSQTAAEKPANGQDNAINGNNAQKNVHTSVRVFHPPGGKSNGPLW